ncbi:CHAP domain-containing protein [Rhabdothermincola salaria]|uniref:CHAP domain-containing protein n=1 Tax=Rhabdothermincola salaria TaxID=2903142 RepID=UPI001E38592F|nr:CHAP domain-containing protein [Rhabdothermincola salaria]MCD9625250.1 CHAP domain-containing protein [Rhabdothermincola salaria]
MTTKDRPVHRTLKRVASTAALAALLAGTGLATTPREAAATGGYPHSSATNCAGQFGIYSWCVDRDRSGWFSSAEQYSQWGFSYRNCTDYVAWKINSLGVPFANTMGGKRFGNATNWDDNARALGWTVSATPRARSIAVTNGGYGHVAFVESVNADGSVNVSEYNHRSDGGFGTRTGRFDAYIYVPNLTTAPAPAPAPAPSTSVSQYRNSLVRWSGDNVTTWYVAPDGTRLWVPDGGTYNELKRRGTSGPHSLGATTLDQLPDMRGRWVASGSEWGHNRTLRRGMSVRSADGRYRFVMQGDGNLVLYGPSGRALWATSWKTSNWRAQEYVVFQSDGNLVTYGGGRAIWHTHTGGSGAGRFSVQSDGNLVIYRGSTPVWWSGTAGRT